MRTPEGERRAKTLLARSGSSVSIQALEELGFGIGDEDVDEDEDGGGCGGGGGVESSKPKTRQMRVGKVTEKNQRVWSGEWWRRKESTAEHASAIWGGETAERTAAARSWDLRCASVA